MAAVADAARTGGGAFGPATAASLARARDVVPSVLPHVHTMAPVEGLAWSAEPVVALNDDAPAALDDDALGLPLLLGLASSMMDAPAAGAARVRGGDAERRAARWAR